MAGLTCPRTMSNEGVHSLRGRTTAHGLLDAFTSAVAVIGPASL